MEKPFVSLLDLSPQIPKPICQNEKSPLAFKFLPKPFWLWLVSGLLFLVLALFGGFAYYWETPGELAGSGGWYFSAPVILTNIPVFQQNDPRWKDLPLGNTQDSMGGQGCAVTSAAMVLASYGIDTDPQRLNQYLTDHAGYTPEGWIYWEKAAELSLGRVEKAYEDKPSYARVDRNLWQGNPVIVRLVLPHGSTHFVVIVGKRGWDYLIQDPAHSPREIYPLHERSNRVTGLRYYRQLQNVVAQAMDVVPSARIASSPNPLFRTEVSNR